MRRWREVPLYHTRLTQQNGGADAAELFSRLPFVTKREMRENFPHNFLRPGQRLDAMIEQELVEVEYTSGTSEDRAPVLLGHGWWNDQERRALGLNRFVAGVLAAHPRPRRAVFTTPACAGTICPSRWLSRSQRTAGAALAVNQSRLPFLLGEDELRQMAEETADWSPVFLDLDPVHGAWFALYCERNGIRFPSLKFVICTYEFVSTVHRRILERVFGVPVLNLYGSTETGHLLMEDEHGAMRASHETAFLEIIEPDGRGIGDLVVTTLTNDYMPLLRYRIGDLVERRDGHAQNAWIVHGRGRDSLRNRGGQRVTTWDVDQCFAGVDGIAHYQLKQAGSGDCHLRFVRERGGPNREQLKALAARLQHLLGFTTVVAPQQDEFLLPTPSGKFRLTCRA